MLMLLNHCCEIFYYYRTITLEPTIIVEPNTITKPRTADPPIELYVAMELYSIAKPLV